MCIRLATNKEWKMLRRNFFSDYFSRNVLKKLQFTSENKWLRRVGHINFIELEYWFIKTRRNRISHYIGIRVVFSKAHLPNPQDNKGGDIEPKMTDPISPEIPHFFGLRISF